MILSTHGILQSGGISFVGLLDTYPSAAAAYSLRKLRSAYTGSSIRVRRSSDNAEQNIGFTSLGNLDTAALSTFCSGTNGFATTWNDQTANAYNATQSTAANQPQIVSSGTIFTSGSKSAIQNASTSGTKTNTIAFSSYSEIWLYAVVDVTTTTTQVIFESSPNFNTPIGSFLILIDGGRLVVLTRNTTYSGVSCPITTGRKLIAIKIKTNTTATLAYDIYINGALQTKTVDNNTNTVPFSDQILSLLSRDGNSLGFTGKSQELIIFTGDQSANNSGISTNINTYYGIY